MNKATNKATKLTEDAPPNYEDALLDKDQYNMHPPQI